MKEPTPEGTLVSNGEAGAGELSAPSNRVANRFNPSARFLLRRAAAAGALFGVAPVLLFLTVVTIMGVITTPDFSDFLGGTTLGELASSYLLGLAVGAAFGAAIALLCVGVLLIWRRVSPAFVARRPLFVGGLCGCTPFSLLYALPILLDITRQAGVASLFGEPYVTLPVFLGLLYTAAAGAWFGWRYLDGRGTKNAENQWE